MMEITDISNKLNTLEFNYVAPFQQWNHSFFEEFSQHYNAEPIILKYVCDDIKRFYDCIANLQQAHVMRSHVNCLDAEIVKGILTNESINRTERDMADLVGSCDWEKFEHACFEVISPYLFEGLLAKLINDGGLLSKSKKSAIDLVNLSRSFTDSIMQGDFPNFSVYRSTDAWSPFFRNMSYDNTFILFEETKGELWIIAITDFD